MLTDAASVFPGNPAADSSRPEKYYHLIKEDLLGSHDVYETPYYIIFGKEPEPCMILDGGIHGDEIASYMACDTIIRNINLLKGTLVIIPRVNIQACRKNTRYINIDFNHAFPGDLQSDIFEFRLAYEFMWLVDSMKPDIIINLHEARMKWSEKANFDSENAYGQIVISCFKPFEEILLSSVDAMNARIPYADYKFHPHYYSFREYSSLDNFVSKFGIRSYTVETYRGFTLSDRVKLQVIAALQFMDKAGLEFEYPEVTFN